MAKWELDGPPGGQFVDPDDVYLRGQAHTLGSGVLGGWSQANLGGSFTEEPAREVREELRELRRGNGKHGPASKNGRNG